jgi:hypothetical protein
MTTGEVISCGQACLTATNNHSFELSLIHALTIMTPDSFFSGVGSNVSQISSMFFHIKIIDKFTLFLLVDLSIVDKKWFPKTQASYLKVNDP